jgi:CubicO group peptidase (beta-lactamase class C family)
VHAAPGITAEMIRGYGGKKVDRCLTARDLARYLAIFARRGRGISGEMVGSATFIEQTLASGIWMSPPFDWIRYSNHTVVSGRSLGHGGWGGQYAVANLDNGTIGVYLSVIENQHADNRDFLGPVARMLESLTESEPGKVWNTTQIPGGY